MTPPLRRLLVVVCATLLVDTAFYAALTPLIPHYAHSAHLGTAGAGILVAAYPLGTMLGSLPSGVLTARFGAKPVIVGGLACMSASTMVFGLTHVGWLLIVARFVQGLGGAQSWTGALAWLAAVAPVEIRGRVIGTAFSAAIFGALVGPVLGTIAAYAGTAITFGAASILGAFLAIATIAQPPPAATESQRLSEAIPALRTPELAVGLALTALAGAAFGVIDVLGPLQLAALGVGGAVIGVTFVVGAGLESALSPVIGAFSDRVGRARPTRISLVVSATLACLIPAAHHPIVLIPLLVVGIAAMGSLFVPATALIGDGTDVAGLHHGLSYALASLVWAGGMSAAAASSGAVAAVTGMALPYLLLGATCALALLLVRRVGRSPVAPHVAATHGVAAPPVAAAREDEGH